MSREPGRKACAVRTAGTAVVAVAGPHDDVNVGAGAVPRVGKATGSITFTPKLCVVTTGETVTAGAKVTPAVAVYDDS
eukprot:CAMPEP_0169111304 /NCGR_PEP_ID=MMETSP1015-20121227/26992_1 /TAXON_ID=342587 /ORGANISM="Karlodinium micrum, Strain CCMP2283" /LENGTH=77 /DNA_ID=CAMNT_0009173189 /DNA_START=427 /DNA_END=660 /DNA_ORIENTATION=-